MNINLPLLATGTLCLILTGAHGTQKKAQKLASNPTIVAPINDQARVVTAGYMRMHHPATIVDLVDQVKGGRAPLAELVGLVGPERATSLLKADLRTLKPKLDSVLDVTVPASRLKDGLLAPGASMITLNDIPGYSPGPSVTLQSSDYSPHSFTESDLRVGQLVHLAVQYVNPTQEPATATLSNTFGGAAKVTYVFSYTGVEAPTPPPNGPMLPVPDQEISGGGPLTAAAGQDCTAFVDLQFPQPGTYHCNLVIQGSGSMNWNVKVPITAVVTQMGTSRSYASAGSALVKVDPSGANYSLPVTINSYNYVSPYTVTIKPKLLPNGISADSATVTVIKAGAMGTTIHLRGSQQAFDAYGSSAEKAQFEVIPGDAPQSTFNTLVSCESGQSIWEFPNASNGTSHWTDVSLTMHADGSWRLNCHISQTYFANEATDVFGVYYPQADHSLVGAFGGWLPGGIGGSPNYWFGVTHGKSNWIHTHWAGCLATHPSAIFFESYFYSTTLPNPLPTNPPKKYTQW